MAGDCRRYTVVCMVTPLGWALTTRRVEMDQVWEKSKARSPQKRSLPISNYRKRIFEILELNQCLDSQHGEEYFVASLEIDGF